MKATQGTTYRMLGSRLNDITTQLETLRKIGATGKKLNKPSDDPAAIRPVLTTRKQLSNVDRYLETMGQSLDKMQATDGHLEHVENIMQRIKEISINVG
ncbi:MAG: flagellar hook-associated protein 3, partial [Desulfobulbaceae bacterium]|nr:flagellar hook-associated protein 3 [Desulfobulbaceae bacterium]